MAETAHPPMEQLKDLELCVDSNPSWHRNSFFKFKLQNESCTDDRRRRALPPSRSSLAPPPSRPKSKPLLHPRTTAVVLFDFHQAETIILAFQHYIVVLGTCVMIPSLLVPMMGGSDGEKARVIQTLLFVAGINTLFQTLFGTRLPAIVRGSITYIVPVMYIINDSKLQRINPPHERFLHSMRAIQGALIVASILQIVIGYTQVWGIFSRFFSPLGMAPVIGLVGLGLFQQESPLLGDCVEIGLPMLLLVVALSQYLKHIRPVKNIAIFKKFHVLFSVAIIWLYVVILTAVGAYKNRPHDTHPSCRTDRANIITTAPWFMFPYPTQWGAPTFSVGYSIAMMSAVLVSMVESTGAYMAAARLAIATPPPAHVLSRGIGWQGVGVFINGLYGTCTGPTVSVENVGLLGLTRVGSRRVIQISAGFMIIFSIFGKFGAIFASIPFSIFVALHCLLFGLVGSVGLSFLQFTNMNSMRNLVITALSLCLGLSIPELFSDYWNGNGRLVHTHVGWFNAFMHTIFASPPVIALGVAVFLDNTLDVEKSKLDRGMSWWVKFQTFNGDSRTKEFYALPFNLDRFFPPT
ncbi:hypothetical protein ACS0TY_020539 [Phlomoides rotata]